MAVQSYILYNITTPTGPSGYVYGAAENSTCSFAGTATVAFGANGTFTYHSTTGGTPCKIAVFGDLDLDPGVVKACYYQAIQ